MFDVRNQYTFHTGLNQTCNIPNKAPIVDGNPAFTANSLNKNCSSSPENDTGCGFSDTSKTSFGQGFNEAGGGIFAVLRDREGIKIWYFDRESTPNDVSSGHPEPSSWPSPSAFLSTDNCNVDSYFSPQSLILDITLCGTWAGADYPASGCPETCAQQVASAHNFISAYSMSFLPVVVYRCESRCQVDCQLHCYVQLLERALAPRSSPQHASLSVVQWFDYGPGPPLATPSQCSVVLNTPCLRYLE
jgi:hypothetical protein